MKLIRLPQVKELTQLSSAGIYRLMKQDKFPKQIKLSERTSRWIENEIIDYINKKYRRKKRVVIYWEQMGSFNAITPLCRLRRCLVRSLLI